MAVTSPEVTRLPARPDRPVRTTDFVRLKLRLLANGFRGRTSRVLLFLGGVGLGGYLALLGFLLFALSAAGDAQVRLMTASFGGAALVLGSVLLPLVWFGVDDSLDPARFALLPLPRRRLVTGLYAAALCGVPAISTLLATSGLLVPAGAFGFGALVAQVFGVVAGVLVCVAASRAVTSAFATMLRSRRARDLAGVLLACLAALIVPGQLLVSSVAAEADWDRLASVAAVVGWTPFGAPYTVGYEVGQGRPLAAVAKLAIAAATVTLLLLWWSRSLESALAGAAGGGRAGAARPAAGGPVGQLFPRFLPWLRPTLTGAIIARELRYWWRDAKRRANLITVLVIAVLAPVLVLGRGGGQFGYGQVEVDADGLAARLIVVFIGAFAASLLANQFGYETTAYATHLVASVPARVELRARALAYTIIVAPLLLVVGMMLATFAADPAAALGAWGLGFAGYGVGLGINQLLSVLVPYPLPEGSNPFATGSGDGLAKSFLAVLAIIVAFAVTAPVLVAAALLGPAWPWLALPVGGGYGLLAAVLGGNLAGSQLRARGPELLSTLRTPSGS